GSSGSSNSRAITANEPERRPVRVGQGGPTSRIEAVWSTGLFPLRQHLGHILGGEGGKRLGADIAGHAHAQAERRDTRHIGCLDDRDDIIFAKRPIELLDRGAVLLGELLELLGPLDRVFDGADTLLGEIRKDDKDRHDWSSLWTPPARTA